MAKSVPLLDLSLAQSTARSHLLHDLRSALLDIGFLYISNHGVAKDIVDDLVALLPKLFELPEKEKEEITLLNSPHFVGYHAFGNEITAGQHDQKEVFDFATELSDANAKDAVRSHYSRLYGPNQWPSKPSQLRAVVERYMSAMTALSTSFVALLAEALSLSPDAFDTFLSHQQRLKLIHYRSSSSTAASHSQEVQGVGPHKDSSGWLTFLLQASHDPNIPGLQALSKTGEWIIVPPIPGTFVVNVGQPFEVVTNGVCKATTHRVVFPNDWVGDRYSVPFFQGVRLDLTKEQCKELWQHFDEGRWKTKESEEGSRIDSAFLRGKYDTWGESLLRTKIRSHRDVGRKWYPEICERYFNDDK